VYGYLVRLLSGPRMDPNAFFVLFVLRPLVVDRLGWLEHSFVPVRECERARIDP
jgi:hypothetical protein